MKTEIKFASVKQAAKFGIGGGFPPDKQISVKCKLPPPPPPADLYRVTTVIDTNLNYFVITYKSTLTVEPIFNFIRLLN
jgi:hypothetical protein